MGHDTEKGQASHFRGNLVSSSFYLENFKWLHSQLVSNVVQLVRRNVK